VNSGKKITAVSDKPASISNADDNFQSNPGKKKPNLAKHKDFRPNYSVLKDPESKQVAL
jgi:hypothetical protein